MHIAQLTGIISLIIMAVVMIAGIVVTAMKRRDHGRAALLGMAGCIVLLLGVALNIVITFIIPMLGVLTMSVIASLLGTIFQAAGIGLLVWGVIARRNPPQPAQPQGTGWQQGAGWQQPQQQWPQGTQQPQQQWPQGTEQPQQQWSQGTQQPQQQWPQGTEQPQQQWSQGGQQQWPQQTQAPAQWPQSGQEPAQWPQAPQQPSGQQPAGQQPPASQPPAQPGWQAPQQPPYGENPS